MKLYMYLFLSLFTYVNVFAQENLKLTLDWNSTDQKYEVYIISMTNHNNFELGRSKVSIVFPSSSPNQLLNVESHAGGIWKDSRIINNPTSAPSNQYHLITNDNGEINLRANKGVLLFSFTASDGLCVEGVRLYNNGYDPDKESEGFSGYDFRNSLTSGNSNVDLYGSNIYNSGIKCRECPVEFSLPKIRKK